MPKIISLHDVLEPLKQALLASRDVIISGQIWGSKLQSVFTSGDGCWLPKNLARMAPWKPSTVPQGHCYTHLAMGGYVGRVTKAIVKPSDVNHCSLHLVFPLFAPFAETLCLPLFRPLLTPYPLLGVSFRRTSTQTWWRKIRQRRRGAANPGGRGRVIPTGGRSLGPREYPPPPVYVMYVDDLFVWLFVCFFVSLFVRARARAGVSAGAGAGACVCMCVYTYMYL